MMKIDLMLEMSCVDLDDKRLNKRCLTIFNSLLKCPEKSIPSACMTHAETKAAYRFFKNDKVVADKILEPHITSTIQRCKSQETVLYLEDTTEVDYTNNSCLQKLRRLDHKDRQGFYCHTALAVTPERLSLGLLSNSFFDRGLESISYDRDYRKTPVEEKESYRWVCGIRSASKLSNILPESNVVYICDREGDTFHCLFEAKKEETNCEVIIRASKDRNTRTKIKGTEKKYKKLFSTLEEMSIQGEVKFRTHSGRGTKARDVKQSVRFGQVILKPKRPQATGYHDIEINAIMLKEEDPPHNVEAVNWVLLTTIPLNTIEDAIKVTRFYTARWEIELYFKVLKVYCGVEELKLVTPSRLQACLAVYMIVAWRLLLIRNLAESYPEEECTLAFTDLEWKIVYMKILQHQKKDPRNIPKQVPTMQDFIVSLAKIGGFLGRKGDKKPGIKSLCQGYSVMRMLVEGWEMCQLYQTCG